MHCVKIPYKPQNAGPGGLYATVHLAGRLPYHLGMARDPGLPPGGCGGRPSGLSSALSSRLSPRVVPRVVQE